jgi:flagellar biosynthesis/type III secretory pathway M-ring protein FliF/YscJ
VEKFIQLDIMDMVKLEMEQQQSVKQLNKFNFLKIFLLLIFVVVILIVYQFLIKWIFLDGDLMIMVKLEMVKENN